MRDRSKNLVALACFIPFAVLLWAWWHYSVNVWHNEQFIQVDTLLLIVLEKRLVLSEFFRQYDVHHVTGYLILSTLLAVFTEWNVRLEQLMLPLTNLGCFALLMILQRRTLHMVDAGTRALLAIATSAMLFSLTLWRVWTVSITLSYLLVPAFIAGAIVVATNGPLTWRRLSIIIFLCLAASFSFTNGLFAWPVLMPLLWYGSATWPRKRRLRLMLYWPLLAAITTALYYLNFQHYTSYPETAISLDHLASFILFSIVFLGKSVGLHSLVASTTIGITVLAIGATAVARCIRNPLERDRLLPWLCLLLLIALSAVLAAAGRAVEGLHVINRHLSISTVGIIAALHLLALLVPRRPALIRTAAGAIIVILFVAGLHTLPQWERIRIERMQGLACIQTIEFASNACLRLLASNIPEAVRREVPKLIQMNYLQPFLIARDARYETIDPPSGVLEGVRLPTSPAEPFVVWGWAMLSGCRPAEHVLLTTDPDHTPVAHTVAVIARPRAPLPAGCWQNTGWRILIDPDRMPTDLQSLQAWVWDAERNAFLRLRDLRAKEQRKPEPAAQYDPPAHR